MFDNARRKIAHWRLRRIAVRRLNGLDDRLLNDIGTSREDIARFVAETRYR